MTSGVEKGLHWRYRFGMAFCRMFTGGWLAYSGYQKIASEAWMSGQQLGAHVGVMASVGAVDAYRPFLSAVGEHLAMLAPVIAYGELAIALCLMVGLLTPYMAALALMLAINKLLGNANLGFHHFGYHAAIAALAITIIVGKAGRSYAVDWLLFVDDDGRGRLPFL